MPGISSAAEWQMLGRTYTSCDSLLLAFATLAVLMLVTIGMVPPIMKKPDQPKPYCGSGSMRESK